MDNQDHPSADTLHIIETCKAAPTMKLRKSYNVGTRSSKSIVSTSSWGYDVALYARSGSVEVVSQLNLSSTKDHATEKRRSSVDAESGRKRQNEAKEILIPYPLEAVA
jgi:hypothetical protein